MFIPKIWRRRSARRLACAVLLLEGAASNGDAAVKNANLSLAEFQRIRNWLVWPEPDFPRTPTQKPLLSRIREVAAAKMSKAAAPRAPQADSLQTLIAQITGRASSDAGSDASLEAELNLSSLDRVEFMDRLEGR